MGSPAGVLFASFFVGIIESLVLKDRLPSIFDRYVDDIFEEQEIQKNFDNYNVHS